MSDFDYKKAYYETSEQLQNAMAMLATSHQNDDRIAPLFELRDVIDKYEVEFITNRSKLSDEKRTRSEEHLKFLIKIFNLYGAYYFGELASRKKCFGVERELMAARMAIVDQKEEIEKLKAMLKWEQETTP